MTGKEIKALVENIPDDTEVYVNFPGFGEEVMSTYQADLIRSDYESAIALVVVQVELKDSARYGTYKNLTPGKSSQVQIMKYSDNK